MFKNFKRIPKSIVVFIMFFAVVMTYLAKTTSVFALSEYGEGNECFKFDIDNGGFPVSSITINGDVWDKNDDYVYYSNNAKYTIVILAGKLGSEFPEISTPGGYDQYGTYEAVPNENEDPNVEGDEYKFTLVVSNVPHDGTCAMLGLSIHGGPEPTIPSSVKQTEVTIKVSGDELEYHYVADKPDEADVCRFKFGINGDRHDEQVPFTFGNAHYVYNDNPAPNNVSSVNTINPIEYEYEYDNSGYVTFFVNGAASDEYTKIQINGVDYSNQAPHTQVEVFEHLIGRASRFEIRNVPYSENGYDVVVEGRRLEETKTVTGFGWTYKKESEESYNPNEDSLFSHGSLEFVKVKYTDIDGVDHVFNSAREYNAAKYHGTGEIYEWKDGNKNYTDLSQAWGEALVPYGAELTLRIVPDTGYQLVGITNSPNGFTTTNEVGVYKIVINKDNLYGESGFHLGARFEEVGNDFENDSNVVRNGNINLNINNDNAFANGTAKLEIRDVNPSESSTENFENTAASEGYEIDSYLDLSLYNTIYKGGKTDNNGKSESWDTPVSDLAENATVTLELNNDMSGKDLAIIHEVHDGNQVVGYDLIDANYDEGNNTITFETDSFSNYAIVYKQDQNQDPNPGPITVEFNSNGGSPVGTITIMPGDLVEEPQTPSNGDKIFDGWFEDEKLEARFDFQQPVNESIVLYAKWVDEEDDTNKDTKYTIKDDAKNTITFMEEAGHHYNLSITDYLSYSKEELMSLVSITSEEYDAVFNGLRESSKKYGNLIGFYSIEVNDADDGHSIERGPFYIKLFMTEEMKKYNSFTILYAKDDLSLIEPLELTVEGDYLVGRLEHLSNYVLTGTNVTNTSSNPQTGDNVYLWIEVLIISTIGLLMVGINIYEPKKIK